MVYNLTMKKTAYSSVSKLRKEKNYLVFSLNHSPRISKKKTENEKQIN